MVSPAVRKCRIFLCCCRPFRSLAQKNVNLGKLEQFYRLYSFFNAYSYEGNVQYCRFGSDVNRNFSGGFAFNQL